MNLGTSIARSRNEPCGRVVNMGATPTARPRLNVRFLVGSVSRPASVLGRERSFNRASDVTVPSGMERGRGIAGGSRSSICDIRDFPPMAGSSGISCLAGRGGSQRLCATPSLTRRRCSPNADTPSRQSRLQTSGVRSSPAADFEPAIRGRRGQPAWGNLSLPTPHRRAKIFSPS
jgi:hypothetical protein